MHIFVVPVQWMFVISDTLIVLFTYLLTYVLTMKRNAFYGKKVKIAAFFKKRGNIAASGKKTVE